MLLNKKFDKIYRGSPHKKSAKDQPISISRFSFFPLEASGAEGTPSLLFSLIGLAGEE